MAHGCQVSADLVSASGAEADTEQREALKVFDGFPIGEGSAAGWKARSHSGTVFGIAGYGFLDAALAFHFALNQSEVDFFDFAGGELAREFEMCLVGSGDDERPAGEAIEAMDDTGANLASDGGESLEAMDKGVGDRAALNTGAGVDGHAGWLIDHHAGGIFVEDWEGDIFRFGFERSERGGFDFQFLGALDEM
jgi:hypothetical protein